MAHSPVLTPPPAHRPGRGRTRERRGSAAPTRLLFERVFEHEEVDPTRIGPSSHAVPGVPGRPGQRARRRGARPSPGRWQDSCMTRPAHPRVAEVADLLAASGAAGQVRELPGSARTAAEAAVQLGVPVGAIANSLLFDVDGAPLLVLTSGGHRVDETQVAGLLGVPRVRRASPEVVREHTGQPMGGVAPIGHPEPIGTLVDVELSRYERVWASAGHPTAVFPTS